MLFFDITVKEAVWKNKKTVSKNTVSEINTMVGAVGFEPTTPTVSSTGDIP